MRRLAVIVTVATALAITVIVKGQGKTDPALKLAPEWAAGVQREGRGKNRLTLSRLFTTQLFLLWSRYDASYEADQPV
jgi:hypothetical protein